MKKKVLVSILIILLIAFLSTTVFADQITDSMRSVSGSSGNSKIIQSGGQVLGIIQAVGMAVAVIMLMVIAVRFMLASASEKAQIKEQLTPYFIGAILLFGSSGLLGIAYGIGTAINGIA